MTHSTQQTRAVVVGVGRFGALHARVWGEAGAEVVGLCDVDGDRLTQVAERSAIDTVDTDAATLIERSRPDVVVIATDEHTHVDVAVTALEASCHVFVEKPLALNGADAKHIREASAAAGRHVVTGQISRFAAPYRRMRSSLGDGRIGELLALRLRRDFSRAWFAAFGSRVHPVWESCIHDIDLAIGFAGRPAERVMAMQSDAAGDAAASVVAGIFELEGGILATIESAWLVPESAPQTISGALELEGSIVGEAELLGSSGLIRQRLVGDSLVEWTPHGVYAPDLSLWPEDSDAVGGALRSEVDYALAVFQGRRANDLMPLSEACWGVEAAEAMVRSLETGAPVEVERH